MDYSNKNKNNKRNIVCSDELPQLQQQNQTKKTCPISFPIGSEAVVKNFSTGLWPKIESLIGKEVVERFCAELWPQIEPSFRQQVREEVDSLIQSHIQALLPSLSKKVEIGKHITTTGSGSGSGTLLKFKLCFCNPIASIIFTNNEIKANNGEHLKLIICDVANLNTAISTGPLSSAQIEFFILDGECGSGQRRDETYSTSSDFNKSILTPRDGKRPLIIGDDLKLCLENGVVFIKNLIITDNSSWMKSKMFCLGAKIKDEIILAEFPRVGEAVSLPFRVMDQRGEVNKKHHPPSKEDELWRLEGIAKDGTYHKNLGLHGINNVGDFLIAYHEMGPSTLKTLLGTRVLDKTWNVMVKNAKECVDVPTYDQSFETNLEENIVMGGEASHENVEVSEQNNVGEHSDEEWFSSILNFDDLSPSNLLILSGEASTSHEAELQSHSH